MYRLLAVRRAYARMSARAHHAGVVGRRLQVSREAHDALVVPIADHRLFRPAVRAAGSHCADPIGRAGGKMIGGFALVAYPAQYGNSGVMTFVVNHQGVVYEKDLGRRSASVVASMPWFNPDRTWRRVADGVKAPAGTR